MSEPTFQPDTPNFRWREYIGAQLGSTERSRWANDGCQVDYVIDIPWDDRKDAIKNVLGYSYRDANSNLRRVTPMRHPYWTWLFATSMTQGEGIKWEAKVQADAGPVSRYSLERYTLTFSTLPYRVMSDVDINFLQLQLGLTVVPEWERYMIKWGKPTYDVVQLDGRQWVFSTGPTSLLPDPSFKGSMPITVPTRTLLWKWMLVPDTYLFNAVSEQMSRIEGKGTIAQPSALGRVNETAFAGYGPGTLLLEAVDPEPVMAPADPQNDLLMPNAFDPPRLWNLSFHIKLSDPPRNATLLPNTYIARGWNLAPDMADPNGYWWPVLSKNGGVPPYRAIEFANLFQAAN